MRLHFPLLALLALAGCAHTPRTPPPSPPSMAIAPVTTPRNTVQLKPVEQPNQSTVPSPLTAERWLDEYFITIREFEEKCYQAALATHPEWTPQIEAMRNLDAENERMARFVFLYYYQTRKGEIRWTNGNWARLVLPCNCGRSHQNEIQELQGLSLAVLEARRSLAQIADETFRNSYNLAVGDLRRELWAERNAQMGRLKVGFLRFMRKPTRDTADD